MDERTRRSRITRRQAITGLTASVAGALATEAHAQSPVSSGTSCVLTPQTSEGPFYFDPELVRSEITEGQPGVPLTLDIRVVNATDCAPIRNARVDVWHADASGIYSGYGSQWGTGASQDRSAVGRTFLRGTQFADADGHAVFRTVYPSWYRGRTPHIHIKVFPEPREVAVSQLYFPDPLSERVFASSPPYAPRKKGRDTYNEDDMYLRGRVRGAFCEVERAGEGYRARAVIGIQRP